MEGFTLQIAVIDVMEGWKKKKFRVGKDAENAGKITEENNLWRKRTTKLIYILH
jgi:hypothetical protein